MFDLVFRARPRRVRLRAVPMPPGVGHAGILRLRVQRRGGHLRHPQGQVRGAGVLGARHLSVRGVQVPPDGGGGVLGEVLPGVPGENFQKSLKNDGREREDSNF